MSTDRILLLGSTGASGLAFIRETLTQPLSQRPSLTLLVRNPSKLPAELVSSAKSEDSQTVRVVQGGLDDEAALDQAMHGVTAVVAFLGPPMSLYHFLTRTAPTPIADSFTAVKRVMKAHGVKRILALSTPSQSLPGEKYTWTQWLTTQIIPPFVLPQANAEMIHIASSIADPSLDYTVFRVPFLNDGPADKEVHAGFYAGEFKGKQELSRASMARWVLREIREREWVGQQPALGNL